MANANEKKVSPYDTKKASINVTLEKRKTSLVLDPGDFNNPEPILHRVLC